MPVIPVFWEAEVRRIKGWPGQKHKTLSEKQIKKPKGWGLGLSGGPEFNPQYCQKLKIKKRR
jgi:hypothetical protein